MFSTVTIGRMKTVDFSNYTFLETTSLLARADLNVKSLVDLAGKKIGVVTVTP